MKNYFITGATGAIGAALVPLLMKDPDARVSLLLRAKNQSHLHERMAGLMNFWGYTADDQAILGRITPLMGDVTLPNFGLSPEIYQKIAEQCTHIIHSAGNVRMNLPLAEARRSAVDSAHHIIDLAMLCRKNGNFKKVEFVSTIGVSGKMSGAVPETWLNHNRQFHNTYEQAKAEAELVVRDAIAEGIPITVHRPSMVVGDSRTGEIIHFQIFYHICEFLSGRRTLGVVPRIENIKLDIIPADYVAKVIAWSKSDDKATGCILHECSGSENSLTIHDLTKRIQPIFRKNGIALPKKITVPVWLFRGMLPLIGIFVSKKMKRSLKVLPVFFDYLQENQEFGNEKTRAWLEESGIALPNVDSYLENVLEYYLEYGKRKGS